MYKITVLKICFGLHVVNFKLFSVHLVAELSILFLKFPLKQLVLKLHGNLFVNKRCIIISETNACSMRHYFQLKYDRGFCSDCKVIWTD